MPGWAAWEYLRRTQDCCPRCSRFFVMVADLLRVVHPHNFSHWICPVFQRAHMDISEEDMCLVQVQAHEVRAVATNALFKKIRSIPAVLRAGTWKSMSTFASFYLRDVTHRYLDTFSLGPIVSAVRVIHCFWLGYVVQRVQWKMVCVSSLREREVQLKCFFVVFFRAD